MDQNRKTKLGLALSFFAFIFFAGILYFAVMRNNELASNDATLQEIQNVSSDTAPADLTDEEVLAQIKSSIETSNQLSVDSIRPMTIAKKIDITEDGVEEYIIDLGLGGAATDAYAIAMIQGNRAVLPDFIDQNGKAQPQALLVGSGGGGRYYSDFVVDETDDAIYVLGYSIYGDNEDYCLAAAYLWDGNQKVFRFSRELSAKPQAELDVICEKAKQLIR